MSGRGPLELQWPSSLSVGFTRDSPKFSVCWWVMQCLWQYRLNFHLNAGQGIPQNNNLTTRGRAKLLCDVQRCKKTTFFFLHEQGLSQNNFTQKKVRKSGQIYFATKQRKRPKRAK